MTPGDGGSGARQAGEVAPAPAEPAASPSIVNEPAAPAAAPESYVDPSGTFVPEWSSKLPEAEFGEFRSKLALYKSPTDLARALKHANQLIGQKGNMVAPLTPESSPEEVARYRKAMGVPDNPKEYGEAIRPKIEVPPNVRWDDAIADRYMEAAHKHNIKPEAMQELIQLNLKQQELSVKAARDMIEEKRQNSIQQLRQTWGANFDRNKAIVQNAAIYYGVSTEDPGFASPAVVKMIARMAKDMEEDKFVSAGSSLPSGSADFRAKAKDIQTNADNPLHKKYWGGDADVQRMVREYWRKGEAG
jgi:hypothetical protein